MFIIILCYLFNATVNVLYLHRWHNSSCLSVSISAHASTTSLVEVVGLSESPKAVLVTVRGGAGGSIPMDCARTIVDLARRGRGYVLNGSVGCCGIVVLPGLSPKHGHLFSIIF